MTDYQEAALAACLKARAEASPRDRVASSTVDVSIIRAIKYLREATGLRIRECKPLVEWAMPRTESAEALPDGSIVA